MHPESERSRSRAPHVVGLCGAAGWPEQPWLSPGRASGAVQGQARLMSYTPRACMPQGLAEGIIGARGRRGVPSAARLSHGGERCCRPVPLLCWLSLRASLCTLWPWATTAPLAGHSSLKRLSAISWHLLAPAGSYCQCSKLRPSGRRRMGRGRALALLAAALLLAAAQVSVQAQVQDRAPHLVACPAAAPSPPAAWSGRQKVRSAKRSAPPLCYMRQPVRSR